MVGALALAAGLTAVLLPLIEGRQQGWPLWTWVSLAAAPAILGAFVAHQARQRRNGRPALLDLTLFGSRAFSAGLLTQLLLACTQASFFVYLALFLQQGRGLGPLEAGLVFTILAVAYVAVSGPAPKLTERYGRLVVAAGGVCLVDGLGLPAWATAQVGVEGTLWAFVPGLVLVGMGIGLCFTPLTSTVLGQIEPAQAGSASGALSTTQQVGFALGVAITGLIFFGAGSDVAHAFELSLLQLTALAVGIVIASRLLPRRAADRVVAEAAGSAA